MESGHPFAKLQPLRVSDQHDATSLDNFRLNLMFQLSTRDAFKTILQSTELQWVPKADDDSRGFKGSSKVEQCAALELMLGVIASYVPVISRRFICDEATSLEQIWRRLRTYYGCKKTGGSILGFLDIKQKTDESAEALWERMHGFLQDNLLSKSDGIKHTGFTSSREGMSPSLQNILVGAWLKTIHPALPGLVQLKFSVELQTKSVYTIREALSQALPSLLLEAQRISSMSGLPIGDLHVDRVQSRGVPQNKRCCLCDAAKRPGSQTHYLSECTFLPEKDREFIRGQKALPPRSRTRQVGLDAENPPEDDLTDSAQTQRVSLEPSPTLMATCGGLDVFITLDSGAETNLISSYEKDRLRLSMRQTRQSASQADGRTPLHIRGECQLIVKCGHHQLKMDCLVVDNLSCPILAGVPFHSENKVFVRMDERKIHIADCCSVDYSQSIVPLTNSPSCQLVSILRAPCRTTILCGESLSIDVPLPFSHEEAVAIEPRHQPGDKTTHWLQPQIIPVENGKISLTNCTSQPILINRHDQFANARRVAVIEDSCKQRLSRPVTKTTRSARVSDPISSKGSHAATVIIDPSNRLPESTKAAFSSLHRQYDDVFSPKIGLYNGASGPFKAIVNMGPTLPPQRKGRTPMYSHSSMQTLQDKIDELCDEGVLETPEFIGITAEYLNPAFLVKKTNGHRLVTSFGEVAQYSKPQQSLLPNVDQTLRSIGQWEYIVKTDLRSAYYQIPLARSSMKFCGISSPFKGTRIYTRCAMGMPGSETALEQLLSLLLGELVKAGKVAKLADDLYCGGPSPEAVLQVWEKVLKILHTNGLRLSPSKTVVCPASTEILGWVWNDGVLTASPHRISALQTCALPTTVFGLRSFNGAFKFVSKVLPQYCDVLHPLEEYTAGKDTKEKIVWSRELEAAFKTAQAHLSKATNITLPRHGDRLVIITDASISNLGLAATLLIERNGRRRIAGFFNAKMKPHHRKWLPCESEALAIGSAVTFFAPYIIQSKHKTVVLTDSRPCVQAYEKLCRGEFSTSARVHTFLSTLANYGIRLQHIRGVDNSTTDFSSRHPVECSSANCQVCRFVSDIEEAVVSTVISDISNVPSLEVYTNRPAWLAIQRSCPTLQRVHAHLTQGTRPSKKEKKVSDVRKYLSKGIRVSADGLLVKPSPQPASRRDLIIVPRKVAHGIVTAIHLKLNHPSKLQLQRTIDRFFFALNSPKIIETVYEHCDACKAIATVPTTFKEQTSSNRPTAIGQQFSADVICRAGQKILMCRENITAYTSACLIPDESSKSCEEGLLKLLSPLRSTLGEHATVRVDPAPGFQNIVLNPRNRLRKAGVTLELGDAKNRNKNPIAERAIREIHAHLVRRQPTGGPVSEMTLAQAIGDVNSQIREPGVSAYEQWTQRSQYDGSQLPMSDLDLINVRENQRQKSHKTSAKYHARGRTESAKSEIRVGQLVYLHEDRDKTRARDRYIVTDEEPPYLVIQKFTGNQLRSKRYRVRARDCNPIAPSIHELSDSAPSDEDIPDILEDTNFDDPTNNPVHSDSDDYEDNMQAQYQYAPPDPGLEPDPEPPRNMDNNVPPEQLRGRFRAPPLWSRDYVMGNDSDYDNEEDL